MLVTAKTTINDGNLAIWRVFKACNNNALFLNLM